MVFGKHSSKHRRESHNVIFLFIIKLSSSSAFVAFGLRGSVIKMSSYPCNYMDYGSGVQGYSRRYDCRPKYVSASLDCDLGCTPALSVSYSIATAAACGSRCYISAMLLPCFWYDTVRRKWLADNENNRLHKRIIDFIRNPALSVCRECYIATSEAVLTVRCSLWSEHVLLATHWRRFEQTWTTGSFDELPQRNTSTRRRRLPVSHHINALRMPTSIVHTMYKVPSKLRPRTWQENAAQWFLMTRAWYTLDGNQAAGFWTLVWRVETGCRSSDIRRVSDKPDFVLVLSDICEKIQVLWHENVPLKHYNFPRTLNKN